MTARVRQRTITSAAGGYQHVPFTGLYHVGAREYDPRTARWLQRDPIGIASGDPNVYRYCLNDAVNLADPDGLSQGPSGPRQVTRVVIMAFIPYNQVYAPLTGRRFKGDGRGFNPYAKSYRMKLQFRFEPRSKGALPQAILEGCKTGVTMELDEAGQVIDKAQYNPSFKFGYTYVQSSGSLGFGNTYVSLAAKASNPLVKPSPAIMMLFTFIFDVRGNLIGLIGDHTKFPSFEAYEIVDDHITRKYVYDAVAEGTSVRHLIYGPEVSVIKKWPR
ncbi:MAG: RHS repeat-associated core domain-containing protein [Armatimonadetes bacterium]|nr:RHS repeat-associated core domain-containing protein [Armatimonadota bacterium]